MGPVTFWWWNVPVHCASLHLRMLGCFCKPSGTAFPCMCACEGLYACAAASVALCCDSDPSLCGLSCMCSWHLDRNGMGIGAEMSTLVLSFSEAPMRITATWIRILAGLAFPPKLCSNHGGRQKSLRSLHSHWDVSVSDPLTVSGLSWHNIC